MRSRSTSRPVRLAVGVARSLALSLALAPAPAAALDPGRALSQHVVYAYDHRAGLPMNGIYALLTGHDGALWVGTQEGLVRFDGGRFQTSDPRSVAGISSAWITALAPAGSGQVLLGTYGGGLLLRDGKRLLQHPASAALPSPQVTFLAPAPDGATWVGTALGAVRLPAGGGAPERFAGLPEGPATAGLVDGRGTVWVGTPAGLFRLDGGRFVPGHAALHGQPVAHLATTRSGALLVSTKEKGLGRLEGSLLSFVTAADGLPSSDVAVAMEDRDGLLWIGTMSGLARVRGGRVERWPASDLLGWNSVRALAEDREGNVWIGSDGGGLFRLRDGDFVSIGAQEGLAPDAWSLVEDREGVLWIGTQAGLVRRAGGAFVTLGLAQGLRHPIVFGLSESPRGGLWIGTYGGGVGRLRDGRITAWYGREQGLRDLVVRAVMEDANGDVWAGTGAGLHRLRGGRFELVPARPGTDVGGAHVAAIAEDGEGGLWVGTEMHGVLRLREGLLEPAPGPPRGVVVTSFHRDGDGTVWVGTLGAGIWRIRAGQVFHYTTANGLFDDVAYVMLDDGRGQFWISCNRGIYRVARAELEAVADGRQKAALSVAYGAADGIRGRECNGGTQTAGLRAGDGRLWFPTLGGVTVVDPAGLRPDLPPPPPRVEEAVVDGRPVEVGTRLELPPGTGRVDLPIGALGFAGRERIGFRYRLAGIDHGWQEAAGEPVAHYTSLPPGTWRFEVQTRAGASPWREPGQVVELVVLPAVHQTGWFTALVAAALLALALLGHWLRTGALRRREEELRLRVADAMAHLKVLSGLLPICAWCKKIKDEGGDWHQLESFVSERSHAEFSHGMCPECYQRQYDGDPPA